MLAAEKIEMSSIRRPTTLAHQNNYVLRYHCLSVYMLHIAYNAIAKIHNRHGHRQSNVALHFQLVSYNWITGNFIIIKPMFLKSMRY